jgi:hypothetical protein
MLGRQNEATINKLNRESWLQVRALGKKRFIRREMLGSLPIWIGIVFVLPALERDHTHPPFSQSNIFSGVILLPIFLLGAYLSGRWKWQDLEKKYPENSLPPWE